MVRVLILTSDAFLTFHSVADVSVLASLLAANAPFLFFARKYSTFDPNYGALWFRCKEFFLSFSKEVGVDGRGYA